MTSSVTFHSVEEVSSDVSAAVRCWDRRKQEEFNDLVAFLHFAQGWQPPVEVVSQERPDFALNLANYTVGVEVTYAASQEWENITALMGRSDPPIDSLSRVGLDSVEEQGGGLLAAVRDQPQKLIWSADEQAAAKAAEIGKAVGRKRKTAEKPEYQLYEQNWLVIRDKAPFVFLDLRALLPKLPEAIDPFNRIFFVTERQHGGQSRSTLIEIAESSASILSELSPVDRT